MIIKRFIAGVVFCWSMGFPVVNAQDYLKQLEETLQKRRSENANPVPAAQPPIELAPADPVPVYAERAGDGAVGQEAELLPQPKKAGTVSPSGRPIVGPRRAPNVPNRSAVVPNRSASEGTRVNVAKPATGGGYLGMTVEKVENSGLGLEVTQVSTNSPAWKAGFRNGDHLIAVSGVALSSVDDLAIELSKTTVGAPVRFLVERGGRNVTLTAILMDRSVANRVQGNVPGSTIDLSRSAEPVEFSTQAYFGAGLSDMSESFRKQFGIGAYRGVSVTEVVSNSPADLAGIKPGDCIVAVGGNGVYSATELQSAIDAAKPGQSLELSYYRGAIQHQTSVRLSRRSPDMDGVWEDGVVTQEMLTPEYVAALQAELDRISAQLQEANAKARSLEQRVKQLEAQR